MDEIEKEILKLGLTFARDLAQQLITLSTGILALTITFSKDVLRTAPTKHAWLLKSAWTTYLLSICCGIWAMSALTGTLVPLEPSSKPRLTIDFNVRLPAALQVLSFLLGIVFIILFGAVSLRKNSQGISDSDIGKD